MRTFRTIAAMDPITPVTPESQDGRAGCRLNSAPLILQDSPLMYEDTEEAHPHVSRSHLDLTPVFRMMVPQKALSK